MNMELDMSGYGGEIFYEPKVFFETESLKEAYEPKPGVHYRSPTGRRLLCVGRDEFLEQHPGCLADKTFLSTLSEHMYKWFVRIEKKNDRWCN